MENNEIGAKSAGVNRDSGIKTICHVRKTPKGYNIWLPREVFDELQPVQVGEKGDGATK